MITAHKDIDVGVWLEHKKQELERFMTEIKVDLAQKTKLQIVRHEAQSEVTPLLDKLFDQAHKLIKYIGTPNATEAETLSRAKALEELRAKMITIRIKALFKVKHILTPEQQEKFSEHIQEKMNEFHQKLSTLMHLTP